MDGYNGCLDATRKAHTGNPPGLTIHAISIHFLPESRGGEALAFDFFHSYH